MRLATASFLPTPSALGYRTTSRPPTASFVRKHCMIARSYTSSMAGLCAAYMCCVYILVLQQ